MTWARRNVGPIAWVLTAAALVIAAFEVIAGIIKVTISFVEVSSWRERVATS